MRPAPTPFTPTQRVVVALLAFLQFTVVLDFMILSPLGALLMPDLHISTTGFGFVVSAYAFSAGVSGFLAGGFADRFDRKRLLLFFYAGFLFGTLCCAVAPTHHALLAARIVTGMFGGVVGSVGFAIITDLFAFEVRGAVMGTVQAAFSAAQVMGLPVGLYLANHFGWRAPFLMIVGVGLVVGVVIVRKMPRIDGHLSGPRPESPFGHLAKTLLRRDYLLAYVATVLLVTGGFMLMPLGSAFAVNNLKVDLEHLPIVYMVTGVCSMLAGPLIGRLADRVGRYATFCAGGALTLVMVLFYTRLGATPLWEVAALLSVLFIGVTARMVSVSAITSAVAEPRSRGAFMAVNSALQQLGGGIAAGATGLIVVEAADGTLLRYEVLGEVVALAIITSTAVMYFVDRQVRRQRAAEAPPPTAQPSEA